MFWDNIAGIYDVFVNVINKKTHIGLCSKMEEFITSDDEVLECACGTGMLSVVIARKCKSLIATDFSVKMLKKARRKYGKYGNVEFKCGNILQIEYPDASFDVVVAANVLHLLDEPYKALHELNRVCRKGGKLIIPTYINKNAAGKTGKFVTTIGKAGANFKRQFTSESYKSFFEEAGYENVEITLIEGYIPCAVAVMNKKLQNYPLC